MRRSLAAVAAALAAAPLLLAAPYAYAEPIGGPLLTGSDVIVDPGPTADPVPEVPVSAWVLADLESGAILAAKAPHAQRPPASVLKALTVVTLASRLDPELVYTTTYDDVAVEGSRVGLVEEAT
jgi:D-alanyl-D-alanine carboxypeptidase (penicillin-binding protein 5/6)